MKNMDIVEDNMEEESELIQNTEYYELMKTFFTDKKNIELKARIKNPLDMSLINSLMKYLELIGFNQGLQIVKELFGKLLEFNISKDGQSRAEFVEALKGLPNELNESIEDSNIENILK